MNEDITEKTIDPWAEDRLNRKERAAAFTNIVTSDTKAKVVSIEAGFGEGKTFFREAWAKDLRHRGEVVIEFDAWKTDHSNDPLISFVGALMGALPKGAAKTKVKRAAAAVGKIASIGGKSALQAVFKSGADELIDAFSDTSVSELADAETITAITKAAKTTGDAMSKAAAASIMGQLAAERTRTEELPTQLKNLRAALHPGEDSGRVIVIIDELDRCRPDYAISLLEAIKHLFDQEGYVFVLMLNPEQLERTAASLFGKIEDGEPYFAKFIDLRLSLSSGNEDRAPLIEILCDELPYEPWNKNEAFSLQRLKEIAKQFGVLPLTIRQLKRTFLNIELAMRCHGKRPLDGPLLTYLALDKARSVQPNHRTAREKTDQILELFPYLKDWKGFDELIRHLPFVSRTSPNRAPKHIAALQRSEVLDDTVSFEQSLSPDDIPELKWLEARRGRHLQIHEEALEGAIDLRGGKSEVG